MRIESKARLGIVLICLCVLIVPVMAAGAYTTIQQGGYVFIGEQGLDLTHAMAGDTAIGWWASGAAIATSSPDAQMQVTPLSNFVISSAAFGQNTGTWLRLNALGKTGWRCLHCCGSHTGDPGSGYIHQSRCDK